MRQEAPEKHPRTRERVASSFATLDYRPVSNFAPALVERTARSLVTLDLRNKKNFFRFHDGASSEKENASRINP